MRKKENYWTQRPDIFFEVVLSYHPLFQNSILSPSSNEHPHPKFCELECVEFHLAFTNGGTFSGYSPFVEIKELVKGIEVAKSGALIVKNTQAAASALDQLVPLLEDGILTQEEFDRAKDGFLGATVEVRESSVGLLRQIYSLHQSGVLSESEFNMKK